jgi:3-dehydroquinate synthase
MNIVDVKLGTRSYQIGIEAGLLASRIALPAKYRRCAVVTDSTVGALYGAKVRKALSGKQVEIFSIKPGEKSKRLSTIESLAQKLLNAGIERSDLIVALGGGVVGDVAGFLAAAYMRGIDYMQIPTSLIAQIDSSIGGKTGVDLPDAKNIIGAFHQPVAVLIDPALLNTLPRRHFNNGMAEAIKTAAIGDAKLFAFIEKNAAKIKALQPIALEHLITECCRFKARIVSEDEREAGIRAILNFGHTVGHAIEAASHYKLLHGEAIAIGMVAASRIAESLGLASSETTDRLAALLKEFSLPTNLTRAKATTDIILNAMHADKKIRDGEITFILPRKIGKVEIRHGVPRRAVARALKELTCRKIR